MLSEAVVQLGKHKDLHACETVTLLLCMKYNIITPMYVRANVTRMIDVCLQHERNCCFPCHAQDSKCQHMRQLFLCA